ncbi:hypothetical protein PG988_003091, partial [Apiospora saccharicola]
MARSRASAYKAQQYWVYEAHKREEARDLARQLNLGLPNGSAGGNECDIMYPLHRLVITGKDTTPNLRLLFGPASDTLTEPHARARQTVLLNARSGLIDDEAPYISPPESEPGRAGRAGPAAAVQPRVSGASTALLRRVAGHCAGEEETRGGG